jgi:hypothetical protein
MTSNSIKPENLPEAIVWYYIIGTYLIYLLGAHYFLTAFMGSILLFYLGKKWWGETGATPEEERVVIAPVAWVWLGAMLIIELALIVGHFNYDLGIGQVIKSSSHWFRTWAIFAIFPLAGHLKIRPQIIYRAVCILCLQSIIAIAIGTLINSPEFTYVSPLIVSGGDIEHYEVVPFQTVIGQRLHLFAPWETALGMAANIYFLFACQEPNKFWRWIGIIGSLVMIVFTLSRLAIVCLPFVFILVWFLTNFLRPWVQLTTSVLSFFCGLIAVNIIDGIEWFERTVNSIREDSSGSSRTRNLIYAMTLDKWRNEAPIWGHALNAEEGPQALAHMPIGSHQTWYGILYTHGLVGFIPLIMVVIWSLLDLIVKAQHDAEAKLALSIFLVILISSFTDNIQLFAYIYWQGLLMMGIVWHKYALKKKIVENNFNFNRQINRTYN